MRTSFRIFTIGITLTGLLALAACGPLGQNTPEHGTKQAPSKPTAVVSSAPSSKPGASVSPTVQPTASVSPSVQPTAAPSTATLAPSATALPSATPSEAGGVSDAAAIKQIRALFESAKKGKVPGIRYAAHIDLIEDVKAAWGEPDREDQAGSKGIYATYAKKNAVIGFNKGSLIFDVRSNDPKLQGLTLAQIKLALGEPTAVTKNGKDHIYVYKVNDQYELKFIIPDSTGKVDHISVYSPQDAINNMAG
jgi:hypothetical protein